MTKDVLLSKENHNCDVRSLCILIQQFDFRFLWEIASMFGKKLQLLIINKKKTLKYKHSFLVKSK